MVVVKKKKVSCEYMLTTTEVESAAAVVRTC
jgi:hypothetical protein